MSKNNIKNTLLVHKAGKYRVQDNSQKGVENTHLSIFMETPIGRDWWAKNNVTGKIDSELPDFVFETSTGKTVGLELTNVISKTGTYHAGKYMATATLKTIANQVCQHFKKTKNIALTINIDFWDEKKWCAHTYKEMLAAAYDPGFRKLEATPKEIKQKIIAALSPEQIKQKGLVKSNIKVGSQLFIITATNWYEPHISTHVNNAGMCKEDPFGDVQNAINNKNEKYKTYIEKCRECDLLVVCDDSSTGNYATFTNKIKNHKFDSVFRNVYLLDLSFDTKAIKLKTKNISSGDMVLMLLAITFISVISFLYVY